jgi:heme/copper-type cytochrome/quinol oxidase subunit 1
MNEGLGKWHFWTWFLGFNLTFGPMHMSGLLGQPRRTAVLPAELGGTSSCTTCCPPSASAS